MPFDVRDFPAAPPEDKAASRRNRQLVAAWLFSVSAMLVVMIALGGATRLSGSGLSIMEWAPLSGIAPPWSEAEWQRLFALYKTIPQFSLRNPDMDLAGFRGIFWLEWVHRFWGRLLGVAFLGPLVWFWATNRIEHRLRPRLVTIFLLGGLQGAVGWFMVASGFFSNATTVSPYRLVIHLALAIALYGAVFWTGLRTAQPVGVAHAPRLRLLAIGVTVLVVTTMLAGGFVAGTRAGLDYNTFPLMDGQWLPAGYARMDPFWRNLTENIATIQFNHRLLASLTLLAALLAAVLGGRLPSAHRARLPLRLLGVLAVAQYALGIATLLLVVPTDLGTMHQGMAVLVFTAALASVHALRGTPAMATAHAWATPP
jgi:cytochrome c oxidase assembly protein subunit 15